MNVVSWLFVLLALFFVCVGKTPDYIVACVFMLVALWLRLGNIWEALRETLKFHKFAHGDAMKGVVDLRADFKPITVEIRKPNVFWGPTNPLQRNGPEDTPCGEGDIWQHSAGYFVLFKGKWEAISPADVAQRVGEGTLNDVGASR